MRQWPWHSEWTPSVLSFAPSPRRISPEKALEIIHVIPPHIKTVGVFVDERPDTVRRIMGLCGLDLIQFHGDESPEVCEDFMPHTIKAFRIRDGSALQTIKPYCGKIRAMLLDTYVVPERKMAAFLLSPPLAKGDIGGFS